MSPSPPHPLPLTTHRFRWPLRRHRRRLPTVRLGGGSNNTKRRGFIVVRMWRRVKVKWMKVKYMSILKKMKKYYERVVAEMIEGGATAESFHQRLLLETSFAIPVMGLSFNSYPTSSFSARDRPVF